MPFRGLTVAFPENFTKIIDIQNIINKIVGKGDFLHR